MKGASEIKLAGLASIRVAWITVLVACGLAIVGGLVSGGDGGNRSSGFPGFAFAAGADPADPSQPFADLGSLDPTAALTPVAKRGPDIKAGQVDRQTSLGSPGQPAESQAPMDSRPEARMPHRPADPSPQPGGGGRQDPPTSSKPTAPSSGPSAPQPPPLNLPKLPKLPSVTVPPQQQSSSSPSESSPTQSSTPSQSSPQISVTVPSLKTPVGDLPGVSVSVNLP
ncbi:MAG TPA: hypothetical protein VH501_06855 [Solirubrobacterales bacterium]